MPVVDATGAALTHPLSAAIVVDRWTTWPIGGRRRPTVDDKFFARLKDETPTRVWVNNPTAEEISLALSQGAVGCTTNPAYAGGLLRHAPDEVLPLIEMAIRQSIDDAAVADQVQQLLVSRIAARFTNMYDESGGSLGFVSIQGAPDMDHDAGRILAEARESRALGVNVAPKLPATAPGLDAFETLVEEGSPTIVTEVFSLSQLVETCERYLRASRRGGTRPPFFLSPITGIFGDYLKAVATRDSMDADSSDLELVGVALARACQNLVEHRGYPVTLLCGGARTPFDLTGLVGAPVHVTINWSTFDEVLEGDKTQTRGIDVPIDDAVMVRLKSAFDDVERAFRLDGLDVRHFEAFGPVQHFRARFLDGWTQMREAVAARRSLVA